MREWYFQQCTFQGQSGLAKCFLFKKIWKKKNNKWAPFELWMQCKWTTLFSLHLYACLFWGCNQHECWLHFFSKRYLRLVYSDPKYKHSFILIHPGLWNLKEKQIGESYVITAWLTNYLIIKNTGVCFFWHSLINYQN